MRDYSTNVLLALVLLQQRTHQEHQHDGREKGARHKPLEAIAFREHVVTKPQDSGQAQAPARGAESALSGTRSTIPPLSGCTSASRSSSDHTTTRPT